MGYQRTPVRAKHDDTCEITMHARQRATVTALGPNSLSIKIL